MLKPMLYLFFLLVAIVLLINSVIDAGHGEYARATYSLVLGLYLYHDIKAEYKKHGT